MNRILPIILILFFLVTSLNGQKKQLKQKETNRTITVDVTKERGKFCQVFRECIGAGRANEGLRADWQQQLITVQKEIGFKYIRMHGLLHDDMGVYKEDKNGNPVYNFQYIDQLYDFLLSVHLKPFVELAFMPYDLASENTYVFWWKGNISPPKSYDKWGDLIKALVLHFQERYGFDEVKTWYFEVWNEPDIEPFYRKPIEEYFKLYKTTAEVIKSISKEYRVGGPASAIPYKYEEKFIEYCSKNSIPVDFIATHAYGVKQGYFDETGNRGTILDPNKAAVRERMVHSREILNKSALSNIELHFTEWSSAYTPTDYIHDTYQQAPFILDKIKGAQESVNSLSYWVFTDIFEENGPRMTPFHGGFGLINYQGIKKPAYYAFQYTGMLGETELINKDSSSWVCKSKNGDIQALFWDFNPIEPKDSMNDQVFYKMEQPSNPKGKVILEIHNIVPGKYLVKIFKTGYRVNDVYTSYLDMGAPSQLTKKEEVALKSVCNGLPVHQEIVTLSSGQYQNKFDIRDNDVYMVILEKL